MATPFSVWGPRILQIIRILVALEVRHLTAFFGEQSGRAERPFLKKALKQLLIRLIREQKK
ncbi:hypothetical protein [Marinilabilia rubra]|uniref:Uncharacterized protein n=1 Tax=Marinilabilia rubra TaxID=2162893 RepID=A0A2U2BE50_9BACT|nr:hypothetical protein [Marinilabilia rubra]PWE01328.1 hypothetical protein DDZ16_02245 [Marinilabilia rubra]